MEIPNTDMIEYLLPRYCSGEATVEECRQVEEWIRLSDENYRIAKFILFIWQRIRCRYYRKWIQRRHCLQFVKR